LEEWSVADYVFERDVYSLPLRNKYNLCGLPLQKKYRSHFEIVALMVEAVKDNSEARFFIMKHANINCAQLKKFMKALIEMGFIEIRAKEGRMFYRATEKGLAFLRQYYVLLGMLLTPSVRNQPPAILCQTET